MAVHVMGKLHELEDVAASNERSLETLARAIALSNGQFALLLVRCNYQRLQTRMLQRLQQMTSAQIQTLVLQKSTRVLLSTIQTVVGCEQPSALAVVGLESVAALDDLLASTNQERDQFPIEFHFPLILWVTDDVLHQLIRFAPDFRNWAATSIRFAIATETLIDFLRQSSDTLFAHLMSAGNGKFLYNADLNLAIGCRYRHELESAFRDIRQQGIALDPALRASVKFVLGRDDYANDRIESALQCYQESLAYWQQVASLPSNSWRDGTVSHLRNGKSALSLAAEETQDSFLAADLLDLLPFPSTVSLEASPPLPLERQGLVLFHIGLCYRRLAELQPADNCGQWQQAKDYFQQCIVTFEQAERPDLVARFIGQLGEAWQHLLAWDELQALAERALGLHQTYGTAVQLAQDWGFLAEVALVRSQWQDASDLAQQALERLAPLPEVPPQHRSRYGLLLARSQHHQAQNEAAIQNLKQALADSDPAWDPQLHIEILRTLRSLYFEQGLYQQAFHIKQRLCAVEYQYGYRPFIGAAPLRPQRQAAHPAISSLDIQPTVAQEIALSGRQHDIDRLFERIARADRTLTVIHGDSGVGKSSIIQAGLVPTLQQQPIGDRIALPVVLENYNHWQQSLGRALAKSLQIAKATSLPPVLDSIEAIVAQLQENYDCNRLTVLIFEQFEAFFFVHTTRLARVPFYEFLNTCLNLPFVKIILSLRDDYLHYLLEFERLMQPTAINNNILDKDIRYYLGNFSVADAERVIQTLTHASKLQLEPALVQQLVQDLAGHVGDVHPIELQIVGAQLQANNITTLAQYQQQGPKEKLVEQFLKAMLQDCGPENEAAARRVLYALTDETVTRPLKTQAELATEARATPQVLTLILEILIGGGFVFRVPEIPAERYQLVHDYLVPLIRRW